MGRFPVAEPVRRSSPPQPASTPNMRSRAIPAENDRIVFSFRSMRIAATPGWRAPKAADNTLGAPATAQYESLEMTSPTLRLPSAHQVWRLTESLMNRTEPSVRPRFTPPGWLLFAAAAPAGPTNWM
jgi:hypothetical protein